MPEKPVNFKPVNFKPVNFKPVAERLGYTVAGTGVCLQTHSWRLVESG